MTRARRSIPGLPGALLGLGLIGACGDDGGASASATTSGGASEATSSGGGSGSASGSEGSGSGGATSAAETDGTGGTSGTGGAELPCNGHADLCARTLAEVALPATHNSFSALDEGFAPINANQISGVAQQLDDGIRGLLLDIYLDGGEIVLCHGPCFLGSTPHAEVLADLAAFLAANPREVVVIIYQDDVDPALVEAEYVAAGLDQLVWTWDGGAPPTLGAMIDAGTRLVVSAEVEGPPPAWYHHAWDLFWDTPYTFHSTDEFTCALNRGSEDNPLYLVNHWISTDADLPSQADAKTANAYDVLHGRIAGCRDEAGRMPNLVAVDFYEEGDLFAAVDALNGL